MLTQVYDDLRKAVGVGESVSLTEVFLFLHSVTAVVAPESCAPAESVVQLASSALPLRPRRALNSCVGQFSCARSTRPSSAARAAEPVVLFPFFIDCFSPFGLSFLKKIVLITV